MATHTKRIISKEMDINRIKYLTVDELNNIKIDKRIIAGCRKNLHEIIILSEDYNNTRNVPTIDLRTFVQDRNTVEMIPTKQGFRLDPSQYAVLFAMLKDNESLIHGNMDVDDDYGTTEQSQHLLEQLMQKEEKNERVTK